jgi:hypothetical protein
MRPPAERRIQGVTVIPGAGGAVPGGKQVPPAWIMPGGRPPKKTAFPHGVDDGLDDGDDQSRLLLFATVVAVRGQDRERASRAHREGGLLSLQDRIAVGRARTRGPRAGQWTVSPSGGSCIRRET